MRMMVITKAVYENLQHELNEMEFSELVTAAENYGYNYEVDDWGDLMIPQEEELREWLLWKVIDEGFYNYLGIDAPFDINTH